MWDQYSKIFLCINMLLGLHGDVASLRSGESPETLINLLFL